CTRPNIANNQVRNNTGDGMLINCASASITGNVVTGNSDGIDLRATGSDSFLAGNLIQNNSGNGIVGSHNWRDGGNIVSGNTTADYSGTYGVLRTLADDATPSVAHGRMFQTG